MLPSISSFFKYPKWLPFQSSPRDTHRQHCASTVHSLCSVQAQQAFESTGLDQGQGVREPKGGGGASSHMSSHRLQAQQWRFCAGVPLCWQDTADAILIRRIFPPRDVTTPRAMTSSVCAPLPCDVISSVTSTSHCVLRACRTSFSIVGLWLSFATATESPHVLVSRLLVSTRAPDSVKATLPCEGGRLLAAPKNKNNDDDGNTN